MIPENVFERIEGPEFAAELGVISALTRLEVELPKHNAVSALLDALFQPDSADQLVRRFETLRATEYDTRFAHPLDFPLAVYLWALDQVAPASASLLVSSVLEARDLWWTTAIARRIASVPFLRSMGTSTSCVASLFTDTPPATVIAYTRAATGRFASISNRTFPSINLRLCANATHGSSSMTLFKHALYSGYSLAS